MDNHWSQGGGGRGEDQKYDRGRGGGRGGGGGGGGYRDQDRPMGNHKMIELMDCLDSEILFTLTEPSEGFSKELDEDHSNPKHHGRMLNKLELMARCCNCESAPEMLMFLLRMVNKNALVRNAYLGNFVRELARNEDISSRKRSEGLGNLLTLLKTFLIRMPNSDFVEKAELILLAIIKQLADDHHIIMDTHNGHTPKLFAEIQSLVAQQREPGTNSIQLVTETEDEDDEGGPLEDFHELSIFPSNDDINRDEQTFLRANKLRGSYEDLNHYLDVQFRLLREDFVYSLRTGILSHQDKIQGIVYLNTNTDTDVRIYENVHILGPVCTNQGLGYRIKFDISKAKGIQWKTTKHLKFGSLVALSCNNFRIMYLCTVANSNVEDLAKGILEIKVEQNAEEFALLEPDIAFTMAETKAYFESFRHVLAALQEIAPEDFRFQRYIVRCNREIAQPYYLQNAELKFDFLPVIPTDQDGLSAEDRHKFRAVSVSHLEDWPTPEQLQLDQYQYEALQHCLTKEFALVQGPPGTGKTFLGLKVMQLLLHNWNQWNHTNDTGNGMDEGDQRQKPILVVCYTNHALDQFLEGIKKFSDRQIVRVGSRSKSELLRDCNLINLRRGMTGNRNYLSLLTAFQRLEREFYEHQEEFFKVTCIIEAMDENILQMDKIQEVISDKHLDQLEEFYCEADDALFAWLTDEDAPVADLTDDDVAAANNDEDSESSDEDLDWERRSNVGGNAHRSEVDNRKTLTRRKIMEDVKQTYFVQQDELDSNSLTQMKKGMRGMSYNDVQRIDNVIMLPMHLRQRLYKYWEANYKKVIRKQCQDQENVCREKTQVFTEARLQLDKEIMKTGSIIGMTTTCAARYHLVLQEIQPQVIIVEEAAEVLEAHVVTSLSRSCQHLILIGDHKQLRPSPNVYELARRYNLDLSLFERMVNNGIPICTLTSQHRMRPLISKLMEPIYSHLKDHPSVMAYPNVKGVEKNLYFVTHDNEEETEEETKSKRNKFEAKYIEKLCKYLLLQDYNPSKITVLTPYSSQLFLLRQQMKSSCKGVRIAVVDNFQGEENDIIILSLVRSNNRGQQGFLKIENRVCVALSRAKMGFYVIGNVHFLAEAEHSEIWQNMKAIAEREGVIGPALPLQCARHAGEENRMKAALPKDFDDSPEGGCNLPCGTRLECGHVCPLSCHGYDPEHKYVKCHKRCKKLLCDEHRCTKMCSEPCGQCLRLVEKVIPDCNHSVFMPCHRDPATVTCTVPCEKVLDCGHDCVNACGDVCVTRCQVLVKKQLPCAHECDIKCGDDPKMSLCHYPCNKMLWCGHQCSGTCGGCHQGRLHQACKNICGRTLICGHVCETPCAQTCPPCKRKCDNECSHSRCQKLCGEPCTPCLEQCDWRCKHHRCSKLCSEHCDRPPCDEPCDMILKCGHPCIGLCGEICPKLCRICDKAVVTCVILGSEAEDDARFIVLDCAHIVEVRDLDRWMDTETGDQNEIALKCCPTKCKTPIRKSLRYQNRVKTIMADMEYIKKKGLGDGDKAGKLFEAQQKFIELQTLPDDEFLLTLLENLERMNRLPRNMQHYESKLEVQFSEVLKTSSLSVAGLDSLINLMHFSNQLQQIRRNIKASEEDFRRCGCRDLVDFSADLCRALRSWLMMMAKSSFGSNLSQQQCTEFCQELHKLSMALKLCRLKKMVLRHIDKGLIESEASEANAASRIIDNLCRILQTVEPFDKARSKKFESSLKGVEERYRTGLGISEEERLEVVSAMGLKQGHWFKCPMGHIYLITECGGAEEESKCPECGSGIGGRGHRLRQDNDLAWEMDGANAPAWPTALQR